jgi:hypothetical protein
VLGARFLAFGIAFIYIERAPIPHRLWISFMILIQLIDLVAGVFGTATDAVAPSDSCSPRSTPPGSPGSSTPGSRVELATDAESARTGTVDSALG